MNKNYPKKNLLCAAMELSGSLLGVVDPCLRAATVDLDMENKIYIFCFYYDGPIDEYKKELVSGAASEAATCWFYEAHFIQIDYPQPILWDGILVFLRQEIGVTPPATQLLSRNSDTHPRSYLAYALGQGLLGRVMPSLRYALVGINEEETQLGFYFYYDEKITNEILKVSKDAIAIAKQAFPNIVTTTDVIEFLPSPANYPKSILDRQMVYERNEHLFD